jgi:hypothetical protein
MDSIRARTHLIRGFHLGRHWFEPRAFHVRCVVDELILRQEFLLQILFSTVKHHSTNTPYSSITALNVYDRHAMTSKEGSFFLQTSLRTNERYPYWWLRYPYWWLRKKNRLFSLECVAQPTGLFLLCLWSELPNYVYVLNIKIFY